MAHRKPTPTGFLSEWAYRQRHNHGHEQEGRLRGGLREACGPRRTAAEQEFEEDAKPEHHWEEHEDRGKPDCTYLSEANGSSPEVPAALSIFGAMHHDDAHDGRAETARQ